MAILLLGSQGGPEDEVRNTALSRPECGHFITRQMFEFEFENSLHQAHPHRPLVFGSGPNDFFRHNFTKLGHLLAHGRQFKNVAKRETP